MNRDRFHDSRFCVGIEGVVNHVHGIAAERHRNIPLHEQVHRRQLALRIVRVNQELLEPLQLRVEIVETECDPGVVLVRDDEAVALRNIDLADQEARLHEARGAQPQQIERRFRFE